MTTFTIRMVMVISVLSLGGVAPAAAQGDGSGLARAVEALDRSVSAGGRVTAIDAERLFAGIVSATITNNDGDPDRIGATDCIDFVLTPRPNAHRTPPNPQRFVGPRTSAGAALCGGVQGSFDGWAGSAEIAPELLRILFPGSLGSPVLGRTPGELHAEQFLLTTALATEGVRREGQAGRVFAGGLVEFESIQKDDRITGDSGWAWQGLLGITRTFSVHGRFAQQREFFTTRATTVGADFHPFVQIDRGVVWRFGGMARGGFLYSTSNAMDLGSLEFGGGGWMSAFKELGRVRVAAGTMLQGSKSWVADALLGDGADLQFLADAINERSLQYDLTFGGSAGVDTSDRTRVIGKMLVNTPLSLRDERLNSWLLSAGLSYAVGLPTLNFGYKFYSNAELRGHTLFFQGNFDW